MHHVKNLLLPFLLCSVVSAADGPRISLFDGKSLNGWKVTGNGCKAAVEDGLIVLQEGNGLVQSERKYRDFVLELKWRARKKENWDSGIYFRYGSVPEGRPWPARYQVNLKQGQEGNVGGLPKAESKGLTKPGEWNEFKLTVEGSKAKLVINGQPAWEADGLMDREGYIGLQAEIPGGGQFEFKDVFITELGFQALFNGHNLDGWEGAGEDAAKCWTVADGQIICTGAKGPWLRTKQEFADFNLRFDYKLKAGGNSGVYVRVPADGNHHGVGAGVEIQLLDDKAERYKDIKPYQFTGSVYAIAAADPRVGRDAGEWNSMEIDCREKSYLIAHNGFVVASAAPCDFPALAHRRVVGFLGLQNHSEEVYFRDIRLGPSMQE